MGLDMYLSARFYASEYSDNAVYKALSQMEIPGLTVPPQYIQNYGSFQIEVPLMYWRKANHIHSWFVDNVQDGRDECQESWVSVGQLRELDQLCSEVFMSHNKDVAMEKLPPAEGFFFGDTDVNDWYWEQTRVTMDALHRLLADYDAGKLAGWDFYYRASW